MGTYNNPLFGIYIAEFPLSLESGRSLYLVLSLISQCAEPRALISGAVFCVR